MERRSPPTVALERGRKNSKKIQECSARGPGEKTPMVARLNLMRWSGTRVWKRVQLRVFWGGRPISQFGSISGKAPSWS
jgi:hypothetical protein